jgi:hypothetical protein
MDMGQIPVNLSGVTDIWIAGSDDKSLVVQVFEIERIGRFSNQDVSGWPGHGLYFTFAGWTMQVWRFFHFLVHLHPLGDHCSQGR